MDFSFLVDGLLFLGDDLIFPTDVISLLDDAFGELLCLFLLSTQNFVLFHNRPVKLYKVISALLAHGFLLLVLCFAFSFIILHGLLIVLELLAVSLFTLPRVIHNLPHVF